MVIKSIVQKLKNIGDEVTEFGGRSVLKLSSDVAPESKGLTSGDK